MPVIKVGSSLRRVGTKPTMDTPQNNAESRRLAQRLAELEEEKKQSLNQIQSRMYKAKLDYTHSLMRNWQQRNGTEEELVEMLKSNSRTVIPSMVYRRDGSLRVDKEATRSASISRAHNTLLKQLKDSQELFTVDRKVNNTLSFRSRLRPKGHTVSHMGASQRLLNQVSEVPSNDLKGAAAATKSCFTGHICHGPSKGDLYQLDCVDCVNTMNRRIKSLTQARNHDAGGTGVSRRSISTRWRTPPSGGWYSREPSGVDVSEMTTQNVDEESNADTETLISDTISPHTHEPEGRRSRRATVTFGETLVQESSERDVRAKNPARKLTSERQVHASLSRKAMTKSEPGLACRHSGLNPDEQDDADSVNSDSTRTTVSMVIIFSHLFPTAGQRVLTEMTTFACLLVHLSSFYQPYSYNRSIRVIRFPATEPIFGRSFSLPAQIVTEKCNYRKHLRRLGSNSREQNFATELGH